MHLHAGEFGEDVGNLLQPWPVELHVLARAEMRVALVEVTGNVRQLAQLATGEHAVGDGDPEHRREALHVEAILQAQRAELVLSQFAAQVALGLPAELPHAVIQHALVQIVVSVHDVLVEGLVIQWGCPPALAPRERHESRRGNGAQSSRTIMAIKEINFYNQIIISDIPCGGRPGCRAGLRGAGQSSTIARSESTSPQGNPDPMANPDNSIEISAEEREADSKVDAISAILLVAIAVFTALFWISGQ